MVTWNEDTPDAAKSVSVNTPKMLQNTAYTKEKLNLDHYWSTDAAKDGYHKYAQMTQNGGATPADPTLAGSMNGVYYTKLKVAAEAVDPAALTAQPFYLNSATSVMQLLGIRAMVLFDVDPNTKAITLQYSHNVKTIAGGAPVVADGVYRTAATQYTITFTNDLPTANYFVLGGGMGGSATSSSRVQFSVQSAAAVGTSKTTALCKLNIAGPSAGTPATTDPLQAWVIFFGG